MIEFAFWFLGVAVILFICSTIFLLLLTRQRYLIKAYDRMLEQEEDEQEVFEPAYRDVPLTADKSAPWYEQVKAVRLMRSDERKFFHHLNRALPQYLIFPQVAFGALLQPDDKLKGMERVAVWRVFGQRRADYVVCHKEMLEVVAVVELDGESHDEPDIKRKDQKRDAVLRSLGYTVFRFDKRTLPSEEEITALFDARERGV